MYALPLGFTGVVGVREVSPVTMAQFPLFIEVGKKTAAKSKHATKALLLHRCRSKFSKVHPLSHKRVYTIILTILLSPPLLH